MMHRKRAIWKLLLSCLVFAICLPTLSRAETADLLPTVQNVDLQRYSGRWYEISRLPMWFERKCLDNITATYTLRGDNRIDVVNSCRTEDGQINARGIAEIPDSQHPGRLRVRFAPDWMAWLPVVWGDYWIIDLDPEYRWVMVGTPSRGYLWILSRSPALDQATVARLKNKARELGFDVTPMINVTNSTN